MLTDFAIWGDGNTPPNKSYVRNATDIFSGNVDNPWTRPYMVFVPDRLTKYLGVGATVYSPALAVAGSTQLNSQYFTKWMLEPTEVAPTERITPSAAYSKAREVQITVKPDRVNLFPYPSFEVANGVEVVETNLLDNPSAESAGGWLPNQAFFTHTRDTATKHSGTQSLKSVLNAGTTTPLIMSAYAVGTSSGTVPVGAGSVLSYGVWFFTPHSGYQARVTLSYYDAVGVNILNTVGPWVALTASTWTRATLLAVTSPANTASVHVMTEVAAVVGNAVPGHAAYVDDAMLLEERGLPDYFDGSTPAGDEFTYRWTGAANASTSLKEITKAQVGVPLGGLTPLGQSSSWSSTGTKSLRTYSKYHVTGSAYVDLDQYVAWGKTYTVRVKVRIREALVVAPLIGAFTVGNVPELATQTVSTGSGAPGVYDLALTVTFPAQSAGGNKYLRLLNNNPYGANVWFDDLLIEEGTGGGAYFDGATSVDTMWESGGTANQSRSFYYRNKVDRLAAMKRALRDTVPMGVGIGEPKFGVWTG